MRKWLTAFRAYWNARDVYIRRHEFRFPKTDLDGLWPHVTFGRSTYDLMPDEVSDRMAEVVDTLRRGQK